MDSKQFFPLHLGHMEPKSRHFPATLALESFETEDELFTETEDEEIFSSLKLHSPSLQTSGLPVPQSIADLSFVESHGLHGHLYPSLQGAQTFPLTSTHVSFSVQQTGLWSISPLQDVVQRPLGQNCLGVSHSPSTQ
jgi:hypothetical protein